MNDKIIDNTLYTLPKDIDGQTHNIKELHNIIMEMILEFDRICRKNNIPYALGFGSALGLVNYGGFLPWDDDADIVIMYEDLPRLIEALKRDLKEDFYFHSYETNDRYYPITPTIKLRRKNTYIKENNSLHLPNRCKGDGLFVDICVFMGVPSDKKEHLKLIKYSKRKMPFMVFFESYLHINMKRSKKALKKFEKEVAEKYKDSDYLSQTVIIPFQDWTNECHVEHLSFPKEVILPFKEYDFEGHKIFSFNDPETFVKLRYGEAALKKWDGEKWVDNYPKHLRKARHTKIYSLTREK
jgi:lipopolysaccharide cholinephosphotransferase